MEEKESSAALGGLRVVVVDDHPESRRALVAILQRCGAEVRPAARAQEALELVAGWRPDLLISDLSMPEIDGYRLMRLIRELPPEQGGLTPALALTAYARTQDRQAALDAGFQGHLPKPLDPVDLVELARRLADLPDSR